MSSVSERMSCSSTLFLCTKLYTLFLLICWLKDKLCTKINSVAGNLTSWPQSCSPEEEHCRVLWSVEPSFIQHHGNTNNCWRDCNKICWRHSQWNKVLCCLQMMSFCWCHGAETSSRVSSRDEISIFRSGGYGAQRKRQDCLSFCAKSVHFCAKSPSSSPLTPPFHSSIGPLPKKAISWNLLWAMRLNF